MREETGKRKRLESDLLRMHTGCITNNAFFNVVNIMYVYNIDRLKETCFSKDMCTMFSLTSTMTALHPQVTMGRSSAL